MVNNRPLLRFNGFVDSWEFEKLGEIVQIIMGQSPDGSTYSNSPDKYILIQGNADLLNGYVHPRVWTSQCTKQCNKGDLIMSVRAPAGNIGKTEYDAVIGRGVAAIKGNEFIFQTLLKMEIHGYWKNISCGSTFESLNSDDIKNAILSLPSSLEQTKIGKLFTNIDKLIENEKNKYKKLLDIKKSLLYKMYPLENTYIPSIRFNGYSEKWEVKKLGEITYQSGEKNFDNLVLESYSVSNKYGFYRQDEQFKYGGIVRSADKSKSVIVTPNTFAYNPARIDIGSIGYQNLNKNVLVSPMYAVFKTLTNITNDIFLWYWLKSDLFNRIILNSQEGGVRLVFNLVKFFSSSITIPSLPEQTKIGELLNSLDNLSNLYTSKIEKLKTIKQSLLKAMFV